MNYLKKAKLLSGVGSLINNVVLNLHTFSAVSRDLASTIKVFEEQGCDKESFNNMILAFLLTIEKILGKDWNVALKGAWVMIIASLSYKYTEMQSREVLASRVVA